MGKLKEKIVSGKECTLTYVCADGPVTVKGSVTGVSDTLVTFYIPDCKALSVLATKALKVALYSTDNAGREFAAVDMSIMYSKKDPHIIAIGSESRVAYLNNREFPRYPYTYITCYRRTDREEWVTGKGIDISYGGCCFIADTPMRIEDKVQVLLYNRATSEQFSIDAIVRHVHPNPDGGFVTGVMLDGNSSELTSLVDSVMETTIEAALDKR